MPHAGVYRADMAIEIETSTITVQGLGAYLARPKGGSTSGMLLLPMITGIGTQVRDFAESVAAAGMTALTWDPWHGVSSDDTPIEQLVEKMNQLDDETVLAEQKALLDHLLGDLGCEKAGVIGWCLGGRFALILGGRDARLANVIAYHPTVPIPPRPNHVVDAVEHSARIEAPVLMLYPGKDAIVPKESFDALQKALQDRESGPSLIHLYPQAEHGFSDRAHQEAQVNKDAFAISWPQALAFATATTS
ncbi:hypothetical protein HUW46_02400 [Amycolatopsis sp. CA-230715]|nr:hypothetical protein HUW46_02400 [Amycolatopsis sp. CA-230715]